MSVIITRIIGLLGLAESKLSTDLGYAQGTRGKFGSRNFGNFVAIQFGTDPLSKRIKFRSIAIGSGEFR